MSSCEGFKPRGTEAAEQTRSQSEFEVEFFRRVLQRHPQHLDVLRQQAHLLTNCGLRDEGLACDRRLAALLPSDPWVRYHLACSLAAVGKSAEAIAALGEAVELGYRDFDRLETDPDLESLHDHPRFKALLGRQRLQR